MLVLAFWGVLAAGLALWWVNTPAGSVDSVATGLVEIGRITGLVGGYLLLVQTLFMSRVGWLERHVGANELMGLHRDIGAAVVFVVLLHVATITVGYAGMDDSSVLHEAWTILTTYEDLISAFVATGILVGVGALAFRAVRAIMPYELWYFLHLATYAVILLSYGHEFAVGRDLAGAGRWFWIGLYVFVLACLAWGRILAPIALNLRHRLRVVQVTEESPDTFSLYIAGRNLEEMRARAGQFFRWRFLSHGCWWQAHPFSLSAAPNGQWLRLTIKAVGDHTADLRWIDPGTRVFAEGPAGIFTADRRTRHRALLVAGGSGIAPIRALLEDLPRGTVVLYRASSPTDLIFRHELDWLAHERGAQVHYVVGSRKDPEPRRVMTPRGLHRLVPDINRRDVYLCGPEGLVSATVKILKRLRVPNRQIHQDPFEF